MANIYDARTFQPREGIGFFIARARKTYILALEKELAPYDVSSSQWAVILNIHDGRATTAGELCKVMRYDPGAMTRMLDRLAEKNFLRRVRTGDDRRTVQLELTASGKALRPKIINAQVNVLNRLVHGFTKAEVRQLQNLLDRINANGQ